jgi:uncharacterized membrane protein
MSGYVPQSMISTARRRSFLYWAAAVAIAVAWLAAIAAAPLAASGGYGSAGPIYGFFGYVCHQLPERSLYLAGHQLAVCSRCLGVYAGLAAGLLTYPLWRPMEEPAALPRVWLFAALVPITLDWSLTIFGVWENTHLSRFFTGGVLGAACAVFIMPALIDIGRQRIMRKAVLQR